MVRKGHSKKKAVNNLQVATEDLPVATKDVAVQTDPIVLDTKEVETQTLEIEDHSDIPYEPVPMELADDPRSLDTKLPDDPVDTELPDDPVDTELPDDPVDTELPDDPVDTELPDDPVDTELLPSCKLPPANDDYMMCEGNNDEKFFPLVTKHQGIFKDAKGKYKLYKSRVYYNA